MHYKDRTDAGLQLAAELLPYRGQDVVVLAIPRGGLPVGAMVAKALNAPLDVALAKKIGHPFNPEYAIGAISLVDRVLNNAEGVSKAYVEEISGRIREQLRQRYEKFHQDRPPVPLKDKVVILVDDGMATGNTIVVLTALLKQQHPAKIVVAVPVAPVSAINKLKASGSIDEVVCLQSPPDFQAVGQFYDHFYQVSDDEAIQWLNDYAGT